MSTVRRQLRGHPQLQGFCQAILDLPSTWSIFARANADIAALGPSASAYPHQLRAWLADDAPLEIPGVMSGILALPLLTIIQVVQYFQYLTWRGIGHAQFLREIRAAGGGAQGFCGGLLPAMAVAASRDEAEVVGNAARALRIALGIGAYGELGDDENEPGPTTVVLRAKYEGQADEIVARFPGVSIALLNISHKSAVKKKDDER